MVDETTNSSSSSDRANDHSGSSQFAARAGNERIRVPRQHGKTLQIPELHEVDHLWQQNSVVIESATGEIGGVEIAAIREIGKREIVKMALRYSGVYTDVDVTNRSVNRIVMSGHQPELFHPGVWYKNFVLSKLGKRFNGIAINLVVDNDVCGNVSVRFPEYTSAKPKSKVLPAVSPASVLIDSPGPNVPFEMRSIQDWGFFESFADRASAAILDFVDAPIARKLWPFVMSSAKEIASSGSPKIGAAIAAGRHRLESESGLNSLEVPVSWIAQTEAFAIFARSIFLRLEHFQDIYNETISQYRTIHKIRSRSHPVPELEIDDGWRECPFWIWRLDSPDRRRLFSKLTQNKIVLTDRAGWRQEIDDTEFIQQFQALESSGVCIRPRALTTTLFSRLVLSDLFLHGIGGAKYDQLTDVISERFFGIQLPRFLTLSSTMKLPVETEIVRRNDLTRIDQQIRELKFHPEKFASRVLPVVQKLIEQKNNWTVGNHANERSRKKHVGIEQINEQLSHFVDVGEGELLTHRSEMAKRIRSSDILDSREYSFCLFPESLMRDLKKMAEVPIEN